MARRPALAARILKRYGATAIHVVKKDPYRLALDVVGVGFKTADRIASGLGIAKDSPGAHPGGPAAGAASTRPSRATCMRPAECARRARPELLGLDATRRARRAALDARRSGRSRFGGHVIIEGEGGRALVYLPRMHAAETRLARA